MRPIDGLSDEPVGSIGSRSVGWCYDWLLLGGIGLALFAVLRTAYVPSHNPHLLPALAVVGSLTVPVVFTSCLLGRHRLRPLSVGAMTGAALGGGAAALALAGWWEYESLLRRSTLSMITVALIEEIAKLLPGTIAVVWWARRRTRSVDVVTAGLFLGLAVGAGFAVLETLGYAYAAAVDDGAALRTVDEILLVRGVFSPATHLAWTALNTAAAAAVVVRVHAPRQALAACGVLLGTLLATVAVHAAWDAFPSSAVHLVLTAGGLAALGLLDRRLRHARPDHEDFRLGAGLPR